MAQSNDLNLELELLQGELEEENAPDPLDLIDAAGPDQGISEAELLEALDNLRGNYE